MAFNWMTQLFNMVAGGQYTSAPTAIAGGSTGPLLVDANGRLVVTLNVPNGPVINGAGQMLWSDSSAYAGTGVIKASAATLYQLVFQNDTVAGSWVQFFDKASIPVLNDVPKFTLKASSTGSGAIVFPMGRPFLLGLSWGISSTGPTFTAAGSPLGWVNAQYS